MGSVGVDCRRTHYSGTVFECTCNHVHMYIYNYIFSTTQIKTGALFCHIEDDCLNGSSVISKLSHHYCLEMCHCTFDYLHSFVAVLLTKSGGGITLLVSH